MVSITCVCHVSVRVVWYDVYCVCGACVMSVRALCVGLWDVYVIRVCVVYSVCVARVVCTCV